METIDLNTLDLRLAQEAIERWGESDNLPDEPYTVASSLVDYCLSLEERVKELEKTVSKLYSVVDRM